MSPEEISLLCRIGHRKSKCPNKNIRRTSWKELKTRLTVKTGKPQKLHNRISLLEKEEEKANRRIEETRKRAYDIIQSKIEKDNFNKKISMIKEQNLLISLLYEDCILRPYLY